MRNKTPVVVSIGAILLALLRTMSNSHGCVAETSLVPHARKGKIPMKTNVSSNWTFALRVVVVMAVLCFAYRSHRPVVEAWNPESASSFETRDLFRAASSVPGVRFVHTATTDNITGAVTYIDHPLANNNPVAFVFVTQNRNPGGVGDAYNDHSIGVYYSTIEHKWAIFNQDFTGMSAGAAFNVLISAVGAGAFVHTATAGNVILNYTHISNALINGNPNAIVFVTQNYNPGGAGGTGNDHPVGVWYDDAVGKWTVFNQDLADMPIGAAFNVLVPAVDANTFVHVATTGNIAGDLTYIDHPLANNHPNAIVLVTPNYNPGGGGGIYNNDTIGVWYDDAAKRWAISNQGHTSVLAGADFNVLIPTTDTAAFVHQATVANITGYLTWIDHPLANDNPHAILFVTQNYTPGGVAGVYNNHPIGVGYNSSEGKWAILNQDLANIPTGAAFNVLIPAVDTSVFVHIARAVNITNNYTYLDHPLTNNTPNALVFVTSNWNPSGAVGKFHNHPVGVWYDNEKGKWAVFNQDRNINMSENVAFNVLVPSASFVHTATVANIVGEWTSIDHVLTNYNPNAIILVTQNWNPGGVGNTYNDHPIGVWYASTKKWLVFNEDWADMPVGADFNVLVIVRFYLPTVMRGT